MTWKIYRRPTESTGPTPDEADTLMVRGGEETATPPAEPIDQLKSDLAAVKSELGQCQDRFLRKAAELENYRKRMDKERAESAVLARSSILMEFLPVADACERAMESLTGGQGNEDLEQYREGVRLLYRQLNTVLSRLGVVPIEAKGQQFNPHLHEAVTREETAEYEDNTVLLELRRGYLYRDRLLRPAQVKVSIRPPADDAAG